MGNAVRLVWAVLVGLLTWGAAQADAQRLVIAGGAISRDNDDVHEAFIARLGAEGRVAVIPVASGEPARSAQAYIETLAAYGVTVQRIDIVRLAELDDAATPETDESAWSANAADPVEIAKIESASAIWFTGGDQLRIIAALLGTDGAPTPMLVAIKARLAAGATVGGTSAGAAIMGETMIARGESLAALTEPLLRDQAPRRTLDSGALLVRPGLGFMPLGISDQHFDRQARLGRLSRALFELAPEQRVGFGVDENTTLVVDLEENVAIVAGLGGVTVLDGRQARSSLRRGRFAMTGMVVNMLAPGDRISLSDLAVSPHSSRTPIDRGGGHYDHEAPSGTGAAVPRMRLEDALGIDLLDNWANTRIEQVSFTRVGAGVRYVFEETPQSWAAIGEDAAGRMRYTIGGVLFAIDPVRVEVRSVGR